MIKIVQIYYSEKKEKIRGRKQKPFPSSPHLTLYIMNNHVNIMVIYTFSWIMLRGELFTSLFPFLLSLFDPPLSHFQFQRNEESEEIILKKTISGDI